ncbi:MAG: RluA family pseudouridine synthase [Treponema sp.]|nr:RluA family pseudouridine synthase [Treponema sp.]
MIKKNWTVSEPCRLDVFLRKEIPLLLSGDISNSKIRRFIMSGNILVNGFQCRVPSYDLHKGAVVAASIDECKFFYEKKPDDIDFILTQQNVLFEDEYLIVVNKPAFLPTEETIVNGRGNMHQAVVDYLWKKNPSLRNPPYAGIMHRLDRETSGVLLFTKTRSVNSEVHDMFERHSAKKTYRAVCTLTETFSKRKSFTETVPDSFSVDNYIGRVSPKSQACKMGILSKDRGGLHSHTDFFVAGRKNGLFYIDCRLLTGRTHQIRVHLSLSGLPIIGDELYGGTKGFDVLNCRIMLHARSLLFPHPVTKEIMEIEAPYPEKFEP